MGLFQGAMWHFIHALPFILMYPNRPIHYLTIKFHQIFLVVSPLGYCTAEEIGGKGLATNKYNVELVSHSPGTMSYKSFFSGTSALG